MKTIVSFAFLALAGFLTDFVWAAPFDAMPVGFAVAAFGVFALGVSAFGVAPALSNGDWVVAAGFSALFGAALAGGAFASGYFEPTAGLFDSQWFVIPIAAGLAAGYGWLSYVLTGLVLGCAACEPFAEESVEGVAVSHPAPERLVDHPRPLAA